MTGVVLDVFPGAGLLGLAFELEGFCVVRGPDLLWGGDVRRFCPPGGVFCGVIGGPPCQGFSAANRTPDIELGESMLEEFVRVVALAAPAWWLLENVPRVPDVRVPGYSWQRLNVDQSWYCGVGRLRHIQFGGLACAPLQVPAGRRVLGARPAALANDGRSVEELKELQGLPPEWDLPGFTIDAKKRAIGNGVPLVMGRVLARAVRAAVEGTALAPVLPLGIPLRLCRCGCGREVRGRKEHATISCRKRAQRRRERARGEVVTTQPLQFVPGLAVRA